MKSKDKIKCEKCGWIIEDYVPDWHNKICPSCKDYVLIDDADLSAWKAIQALINLGFVKRQREVPPEKHGLRVSISTENLRNNQLTKKLSNLGKNNKQCDDCCSDFEEDILIRTSCGDSICPECALNHPCV